MSTPDLVPSRLVKTSGPEQSLGALLECADRRQGQQRFREMIDALPAAIYTTDALGAITHFNPACVAFSGRTPVLGSDHWCVTWKLYYPDGRSMPHDECPMAIALKTGEPVRGAEAIAERPDGSRIWFQPFPTPLLDDRGRVIGGINMLVDITERKQAELARARLAAIVESSDDAIISKDLNGVINSWNRGAERIFGYTAEETVGRPVTMLMPPDRVDEEPKILASIRRGEKIDHYETVRRRKDGALINLSLTVSPIMDAGGAIVGASKIARDITERKLAEAQRNKEIAAFAKLNRLSSGLWQVRSLREGLDEMLSATLELLGADFGNIQILDTAKSVLRIAAQSGFQRDFLDFFREVSVEDESACGRALRGGERILIQDVETDELFAPLRPIARSAGFRAVQSTPLIGRNGKPLGMISTHFRNVHRPSDHELRLLDLYARQASDFIERCQADESLRRTQRLIECQKQALELVVTGIPLEGAGGILDSLARSMEGELEGAIVAIHLMEADGHHFGYVAAPSLPPRYAQATRGMDARLELGCCSSAVVSHTPTIVRDFAAETRWPAFVAEALSIGLRGCFTTPILSPDHQVLGTFAIYYREARDPSPHDQQLVDVVTRSVALAIERKQAEQSLRKSEERYRQLANLLPVAVYTCDASGLITYHNPTAAELWGRVPRPGDTDERFCGSEQMILDDGRVLPHDQCPMAIALRDGLSFREQPVNVRRPDGSMISVRVNIDPIKDSAGDIVGAINVFHDVTELHRAEQAVRESQERYRAVVESQSEMVCRFRPDGTILFANGAYARAQGATPDALPGKNFWTLIDAADRQGVKELLDRLSPANPQVTIENRFETAEGMRWTLWTNRGLAFDSLGRVTEAQSAGIDITARKQAEEALRRHQEVLEETVKKRTEEVMRSHRALAASERMASLGTLAAGLGHDMGNLLVPIRVRLESLQAMNLAPGGADELAAIQSGVGYLQKLATGLRLLAIDPGLIGRTEATELHCWWDEAQSVLKSALPKGIALESSLPGAGCWVAMSRAALMQAVFNLVQNAGEAMRERGNGTIRIDVDSDEHVVRVRVSDDGPGMTAEVRSRCMEPFFTTKTRGVSTGLGLALVHGLVQRAGGTVEIESEPSKGTAITLRLGLGSAPASGPAGKPRSAHVDVKDARQRAIVVAELQSLNFEVRPDALHEADLVVSDHGPAIENRHGKVILLADPSDAPPGAVALGARPTLGAIRQALRTCAEEPRGPLAESRL